MHSKENKDIFRASPLRLSEMEVDKVDGAPNKVQLLRTGKYFHGGKEVEVGKSHLDSMVNNFSEEVRGIDLMIDFSHNSAGEAAAWITGIEVVDKGYHHELWADVSWTDSGKSAVMSKEYRYLSADFHFDYVDNETLTKFGPTLFGAGLTNRPVIKKMEPVIQLSESNQYQEQTKDIKMDEELKKQVADLMAVVADMKGAIEDLKKPKLKEEMGGDKEGEMEDVKMSEEYKEIAKENEKFKKQLEDQRKENDFNKLFAEGKVVEAQRKHFMEGDMVKFSENAAPLNIEGNPSAPKKEDEIEDPEEKAIALAEKKVKEDKVTFSEAINSVLKEDSELNKKYMEKFNK